MIRLLCLSLLFALPSHAKNPLKSLLPDLPKEETPVFLFDGKSLDGWDGDPEFWSVVDGCIRCANTGKVPSSTYLFTRKSFRNFRLLLEVKQTLSPKHSTMHSAVAALGERVESKDNKHGYKGLLHMFCHDWGLYDAGGRNRVAPTGQQGPMKSFPPEIKGEWNRIEILVVGNRIRHVANGTLVIDHTDDAKHLKACPIGLQLHSENRPQEYHFRGLVLTINPTDTLVTLSQANKDD